MASPSELAAKVSESLGRVLAPVGVADVFGAPLEAGDRIVVPAAAVERGGGFGFGGGGHAGDAGGGGGGGGGGGVQGRPVAVVEITDQGVEVHPVLDLTRLGVAAVGVALALVRLGRSR
ncbi:MAG: spore germination protein GerW family protein [Acidimicrobiia bacterium]|nr:spore germination protein GerW family protein [Acidimicrobiia bacterium]